MHRISALQDQEIIDQLAIGQEGLCADAGLTGHEIRSPHFWNQSLEAADEKSLTEGTAHFHPTFAHVFARELPKARIRKRVQRVAQRKVSLVIAFTLEGKDGVWPGVNGTVNHFREMDPKEGEVRIRHGVDKCFDQVAFLRDELVIFTTKRDNFRARIGATSARDPVAEQAATVDHKATLERAGGTERAGV